MRNSAASLASLPAWERGSIKQLAEGFPVRLFDVDV
jgi:hypothetical protein